MSASILDPASKSSSQLWYWANSFGMFAIFAMLWTPSYSLAIKLMLFASLISLFWRPWKGLTRQGAGFIWALMFLTAYLVLRESLYWHQFEPKQLFLLAIIPAWLNLRRYGFDLRFLAAGILVGAVAGGVAAWVSSNGLEDRIGMGRNAISYGGTMLVYVALSTFMLWKSPMWSRSLWWLALIASAVAVMASGTRGAYIPALLIMLFVVWHYVRAGRWWLLLLVPLVLILFFVGLVETGRWAATMREFDVMMAGSLNTSMGHRLQLWHLAWQVTSDYPIFGFGPDSLAINMQYQAWLDNRGYQPNLIAMHSHMHNQYFDLLAKYGLVGLTLWLIWFIVFVRDASPESRPLAFMVLIVFWGLSLTETIMGTNALRYALLASMMVVFGLRMRTR